MIYIHIISHSLFKMDTLYIIYGIYKLHSKFKRIRDKRSEMRITIYKLNIEIIFKQTIIVDHSLSISI